MVIVLRFAYGSHAKGVVGVRFKLVHFDQFLLSFKRHDVPSKTLVILIKNEHLAVWPWDLNDEGNHGMRQRLKPYGNLMAVIGIGSGRDVGLAVQTLIWVVQSHP